MGTFDLKVPFKGGHKRELPHEIWILQIRAVVPAPFKNSRTPCAFSFPKKATTQTHLWETKCWQEVNWPNEKETLQKKGFSCSDETKQMTRLVIEVYIFFCQQFIWTANFFSKMFDFFGKTQVWVLTYQCFLSAGWHWRFDQGKKNEWNCSCLVYVHWSCPTIFAPHWWDSFRTKQMISFASGDLFTWLLPWIHKKHQWSTRGHHTSDKQSWICLLGWQGLVPWKCSKSFWLVGQTWQTQLNCKSNKI